MRAQCLVISLGIAGYSREDLLRYPTYGALNSIGIFQKLHRTFYSAFLRFSIVAPELFSKAESKFFPPESDLVLTCLV
jgi:hypothetical protein